MLIFLSGPYGVGKSTTAEALAPLLDALIFDAEAVGNAVRDNYPDWPMGAVFEDYPLWQECCFLLLQDLHRRYQRPILIPMTLMQPISRALLDRLESAGIPTRLFVLTAEESTIRQRILLRGEDEGCWCMRHIHASLAGTTALPGAMPISTENRDAAQAAQTILRHLQGGNG